MACPDERASRRPEFGGGTPLLLPDGRTWWFYVPAAEAVEANVVHTVLWDFGLDDDHNVALGDALYRVFGKLARAADDRQRASAVVELAWLLLARNYEVAPDQFERVLSAGAITPGLWGRIEGFAETLRKHAEWAAESAPEGAAPWPAG